jgi:hypothetical protein
MVASVSEQELKMNTTELFAELLITGTGVVIWIVFLIAAVFGLSIQDIATNTNVFTLVPIVGLAYVLGIIIDRLGYGLFAGPETRILKGIVKQNIKPSISDKEKFILTHSERLSFQLNYNRSRLRVCRSWCINFLLIAVASGIWAYTSKLSYTFFLSVLNLALAIASVLTWRKLVKDYYLSVQSSYTFLVEQKEPKKTPGEAN